VEYRLNGCPAIPQYTTPQSSPGHHIVAMTPGILPLRLSLEFQPTPENSFQQFLPRLFTHITLNDSPLALSAAGQPPRAAPFGWNSTRRK